VYTPLEKHNLGDVLRKNENKNRNKKKKRTTGEGIWM